MAVKNRSKTKAETKEAMTDAKTGEVYVIPRANLEVIPLEIVGTAPYVQHKFSAKALKQIMETQAAGSTAKSKKKRDPKDFDEEYQACMHVSQDGWYGIPAAGLRSAMIDACRLTGFVMTRAKLSVFVVADGIDEDEGTPLVRIEGEPRPHTGYVRLETGVIDVRVRPMWEKWSATVTIKYDADQFTPVDIANLLDRAGQQVGIGEGRPNSKKSHGQGWGTFLVDREI